MTLDSSQQVIRSVKRALGDLLVHLIESFEDRNLALKTPICGLHIDLARVKPPENITAVRVPTVAPRRYIVIFLRGVAGGIRAVPGHRGSIGLVATRHPSRKTDDHDGMTS